MDGTGDLFARFVDEVGLKTQVVRYPTTRILGYEDLENLVISELPSDEPYVLLGESFSGPIAIAIAARRPPLLRGVVLCCSFATNPRPALAPLRVLVKWLPDRPPLAPLERFLAGRFRSPQIREALARALAQVSPAALRARMSAVIGVDVALALSSISVPLLYLRGLEDRVVPASACQVILDKVPRAKVVDLVAPHFLLQTVPKEAGIAVHQFVREVEHAL
jgi:pimeloyl-ACP methyl ester carboxylesterase